MKEKFGLSGRLMMLGMAVCACVIGMAMCGCSQNTESKMTSSPQEKPTAAPVTRSTDRTGDTLSFNQNNGISEKALQAVLDAVVNKGPSSKVKAAASQPGDLVAQIAEAVADAVSEGVGPGGTQSKSQSKATFAAIQTVNYVSGSNTSTPTNTIGGNASGSQTAPQTGTTNPTQEVKANVNPAIALGLPGSAPTANSAGTFGSGTTAPTNTTTPQVTTFTVPASMAAQALQALQGLGLQPQPGSTLPAEAVVNKPSKTDAAAKSMTPAP